LTEHEDSLLEQALDHHRAGRVAEASVLYQRILEAAPDNADVLYFLSVVAHQQGQHEKSSELARRSLAILPHHARCYTILGLSLMASGAMDEAESSFLRAIELDATADRYSNLGSFWQQRGRLDDALEAYRRALALAPDDATVHRNLGNVYRSKGDVEAGAECFIRSVALSPDDADLHCDLGDVLQTLGRLSDALAAYRRSLELNPQLARACTPVDARRARNRNICWRWLGSAKRWRFFRTGRRLSIIWDRSFSN
jgi:protein O-GlcNAc transferase